MSCPIRIRARGPRNNRGMNSTEAAYAELLEGQRLAGDIASYAFESVKLRLADKTWYTPDFFVVYPDGAAEFVEVKGFWRDDARVKFKVAAEQHQWARFTAVTKRAKKRGGGWNCEELP